MSAPRSGDRPRVPADDDRAPFAIDEWPYLQLADRLEDRIRGGEFGADGPLPSAAELMTWYHLKRSVVSHAHQELVHRNLVVRELGHGYRVRPGSTA